MTEATKLPVQFELEMEDFMWSVFGIETKLRLSFATLLQHNTTQAAVSEELDVENAAKVVTFLNDPPKEISVNDIFQIRVKVTINGGAPLPKAKVI